MAEGGCFRVFVFLLAISAGIIEANGNEKLASVLLDSDGKTLLLKPGYDPSQPVVAWGKFRDQISSTG